VFIPLAAIHVTTALDGLLLALFSWALALILSLFVALIITIMVHLLGRGKTGPAAVKK
jgi:hypothetical protein